VFEVGDFRLVPKESCDRVAAQLLAASSELKSMSKKTGRRSAAGRVSSSPRGIRVVIRTVHVKESVLRRSLSEVLADPIPFPKLTKVDEPNRNSNDAEPSQAAKAARVCEEKAGSAGASG
jgi:hypothetical protein